MTFYTFGIESCINNILILIMQEAYIIAGYRTAVGKAKKGGLRFYRPDDLAIEVIKGLMATVPQLESKMVDDVIVGNAVPEAEQGLQFGRMISAKALGVEVPGITINRYCASGLESIAMATANRRARSTDWSHWLPYMNRTMGCAKQMIARQKDHPNAVT